MKAIAAAIIIALVGLLLVGIQQLRVEDLREEKLVETQAKDEAIKANTESQATITTLRAEAKRNAEYQADLAKRLRASQDKAKKAEKNFEDLKRNSKPVRDWAAQPLPDGLRGRAGGSDKGPGSKNRSP
ncbi:LysB family phage lysis regulatory protein [Pseudomonas sp. BIGb0381]|uniref:hypothetical protein n=1 Tax=Pseudomonas sp. BIGb0381 TaxID=2940608 RepID=UPI00216870F5|nr:hypothetical protein [Pseudomonas sp. BIGb0381]MCS4310242.1 LysB family phage lysis regulatory protein [Pseudomonas sp. BIGb0381]